MRNYILLQLTLVFKCSYQPRCVHENLIEIAFCDLAGSNADLFNLLRHLILKRDSNTLIYPTTNDLEAFKRHNNMLELCIQYTAIRETDMADCKAAKQVSAQISALINVLSDLIVQA